MTRADEFYHRRKAGDIYLGEGEGAGAYVKRRDLEHHAHLLAPTGYGKTRALQLIAQQLMDAGDCSVVVIDPHDGPPPLGGLYHALKCYAHDRGHADRLITLDPLDVHELHMVAGVNPTVRGIEPSVRAALMVDQLRAVIGENPEFAAKPMMMEWGFNLNLGLTIGELAFADARHVLKKEDPAYRHAFGELLEAEYEDVAAEWRWLNSQRGAAGQQLLDNSLGSVGRRVRAYIRNKALRYMLSTRHRTVDPQTVLREKKIVLANLNLRGLLEQQDQRMLGMQLIHGLCRAVIDRGEETTAPCFLIVDEFSEFLCPEMLQILNGGRKFGLHLILAHQFLSQLQQVLLQDWRYYHAVLSACRVRLVFGGMPVTDNKTMAEEMFWRQMDPELVKNKIYHWAQLSYVKEVEIHSSTSNWAHADTAARHSDSAESYTVPREGGFLGGDPTREDASLITFNSAFGSAFAAMNTEGGSETTTRGPMVQPGEPFQQLANVEFWKIEEQLFNHAKKLALQEPQEAVLHVRGGDPMFFKVSDVENPKKTKAEMRDRDRQLLEGVEALPEGQRWAGPVALIEEEARARDAAFRERYAAHATKARDPKQAVANIEAWDGPTEEKPKSREERLEGGPETRPKTPKRRHAKT